MILTVVDPRPTLNVTVDGDSTVNVAPAAVAPVVIVTAAGPQGPAGPVGSAENNTVILNQTAPAATWTIAHSLGTHPDVTVLVGKEAVLADVIYPDLGTVVVVFAGPTAGTAYLRK